MGERHWKVVNAGGSRYAAALPELLNAADVVSIHAALTAETQHLIGASGLAAVKQRAALVHASRGPLVGEAALVAAYRSQARFRAGLDVYENEPAVAPSRADPEPPHAAPSIVDGGDLNLPRYAAQAKDKEDQQ